MTNKDAFELKDDDLQKVSGGTHENYSRLHRDISDIFNEFLLESRTKECLNQCYQKALGAAYAYYSLGLIDDSEYFDIKNELKVTYDLRQNDIL